MTREEEIKCASKDYVNYLLDKQEYHNENYTEDDIRQAFEKGAMFANNNPDTSSLWHDASEKPQDNSHILIRYNYLGTMEFKSYHINYQCDLTWPELVNFQEIKYWAYIDDIFPKGDEQ